MLSYNTCNFGSFAFQISQLPIQEKNIVLGVCGGIAAYKSADLVRNLTKRSGNVYVAMTKNAREFITPLTLAALSGNQVLTDLFPPPKDDPMVHINLATKADVVVIAPATSHVLAKLAHGIADDFLSTLVVATEAPVLICPSMNAKMYQNWMVQDNMKRLKNAGFSFVGPEWGELACGMKGFGRLAEIDAIVEEIEYLLTDKDMSAERVLVTAGPTREPFDPVRFISNPSSGKMGYAMARAARRRGADVTLITGPTTLTPPRGIRVLEVCTALEMRDAVFNNFKDTSIIVMVAAVSDFRPKGFSEKKIQKGQETTALELERNPDILTELGANKGNRILVGFAVETHDIAEHALTKLKEKNLDMIVVNPIGERGAGFGCDTNIVTIFDRKGGIVELPLMEKESIAERIWDKVAEIFQPSQRI
jgi:phosphopantothenoylcysteine decarboxylase/phosphopantothenate--cysteine ligase